MAKEYINWRSMSVVLDSGGTSLSIDFLEAGLSFEIPAIEEPVHNQGALTTQTVSGVEQPATFGFSAKCVDDQLCSTIRAKTTGGTKHIQFKHGFSSGTTVTQFNYVDAAVSFSDCILSINGTAQGYTEGSNTYGAQA